MCCTVNLLNISFLLSILWFGCPALSNVLGVYQFIGFFFCYLDLLISYTLCTYAKMLLKYLFWLDNAGTCIEFIRSIVGSIISNWFVTIPYGQTLLIELVLIFSQSMLYILQVIFQRSEALLNNLIERLACKTQISLKPGPEVNLGQNMIQN